MRAVWIICVLLLLVPGLHAVRESKYYRILGISEDADEQTIKKAYRKAAMWASFAHLKIILHRV